MYRADAQLLKAQTTNTIMEIQDSINRQFGNNLAIIGGQAVIFGSLGWTSLTNIYLQPLSPYSQPFILHPNFLTCCYVILFQICVVSAILVVTQCAIASMLGPTKGLIGFDISIKHYNIFI